MRLDGVRPCPGRRRDFSIVGPMPIGTAATTDSRGRYGSMGSTNLADSRKCAYAEVLLGFRQQRASVAKAAESTDGRSRTTSRVSMHRPGKTGSTSPGLSGDWQMDRSIYEI